MKPINPRQQRFVEEYLKDLNATQAAIRAGYSAKTAEQQGPRLLGNVGVAHAISEGRSKISQRNEITQDAIAQELKLVAFANMFDYVKPLNDGTLAIDFSSLDRAKAAAISDITIDEYTDGRGEDAREVKRVRFKLGDKRQALMDLAKLIGCTWDQRHSVANPQQGTTTNVVIVNGSAKPIGDVETELLVQQLEVLEQQKRLETT